MTQELPSKAESWVVGLLGPYVEKAQNPGKIFSRGWTRILADGSKGKGRIVVWEAAKTPWRQAIRLGVPVLPQDQRGFLGVLAP